jgi:hypothetical protein
VEARSVRIDLTADEALVLFEWLEERTDQDWVDVPVVHRGEIAALSGLAGALQRTLVQPFDSAYGELLAAARDRLAARIGPAVDEDD